MPWQAQGHNKTNFWAALDIKKVISRPPRTHHFTPFQHELLSPLRYYFTTCSPASVTDTILDFFNYTIHPFVTVLKIARMFCSTCILYDSIFAQIFVRDSFLSIMRLSTFSIVSWLLTALFLLFPMVHFQWIQN